MTNPVQIPGAAVRAALDATDGNIPPVLLERALTAALPHLQLGYGVKQLEWVKTHSCNGILSAKTHFGTYFIGSNKTVRLGLKTLSRPFQLLDEAKAAAQSDFERRVRECHVPRPDIKTIIDEIRAGTRQGFLNEGDQPELSDAELSCPYCSGSGHIDDVATNPVDVAAVYREALDRISKFDRSHGSWETIAYDAINIAGRALSAEPAQGENTGITLSTLQSAHIERQKEWCPDQQPDLSFRGNEMAGEVGEACNVIKKLERERQGWRGSRSSKEELASELADVIHAAVLCAVTAEIDLELATVQKFNATSDKNDLRTRLPAAPISEAGK